MLSLNRSFLPLRNFAQSFTSKSYFFTTNRRMVMTSTTVPKHPEPRISSSLVLVYPLRKVSEDGYNYRVLFLKRNSSSSTFVDAHVFPGGGLDDADSVEGWDEILGKPANDAERTHRSMKICAIRETFEEAGILISETRPNFSPQIRSQWRERVRSNANEFLSLFKEIGTRPALFRLSPRGNWITPRGIRRRFNTQFFISFLPRSPTSSTPEDASKNASLSSSDQSSVAVTSAEETPRKTTVVVADGKETVSAHWLTPSEAANSAIHGSREFQNNGKTDVGCILFPPQFYLIAELSRFNTWQSLLSSKKFPPSSIPSDTNELIPGRNVFPFEPIGKEVGQDKDGYQRVATVLPGDELYNLDSSIPIQQGARHRVYVVPTPSTPGGVESSKTTSNPPPTSTYSTVKVDSDKNPTSSTTSDATPQQAQQHQKRLASGYFRVLGFERVGVKGSLGDGWEDTRFGVDENGNELPELTSSITSLPSAKL